MSTRRLSSAWHGLVAGETRNGLTRAVILSDVQAGSPAEAAGFKPGDQLIQVNDLRVLTALDIERGFLDLPPGKPARVTIRRSGKDQALALELKPLPRMAADADEQIWRMLGLKTSPVTPEYVAAASPKLRGGLYVQALSPNSAAARALIQKGDILVGMNVGTRHWETIRPDNILFILRQPELAQAQTLQFYIVRQNGIRQGALKVADVPQLHALSR
jgi:serine protease Do